jgi:hypothetical protein
MVRNKFPKVFILLNGSERNSKCFCLLKSGSERYSEHFYLRGMIRNKITNLWEFIIFYEMVLNRIPEWFGTKLRSSECFLFYKMVRNGILSFFIFLEMARSRILSVFHSTKQTEFRPNESKFKSVPCSADIIFCLQVATQAPPGHPSSILPIKYGTHQNIYSCTGVSK